MDQQPRTRNIKMLWTLILLGTAYCGLIYYRGALIGPTKVDGIIGVLLGLYVCSHPAANVVDMLFFGRDTRNQFSPKRSILLWLALNILVLLIGWMVIFVGTTRLVGKAETVPLWMCVAKG